MNDSTLKTIIVILNRGWTLETEKCREYQGFIRNTCKEILKAAKYIQKVV